MSTGDAALTICMTFQHLRVYAMIESNYGFGDRMVGSLKGGNAGRPRPVPDAPRTSGGDAGLCLPTPGLLTNEPLDTIARD